MRWFYWSCNLKSVKVADAAEFFSLTPVIDSRVQQSLMHLEKAEKLSTRGPRP